MTYRIQAAQYYKILQDITNYHTAKSTQLFDRVFLCSTQDCVRNTQSESLYLLFIIYVTYNIANKQRKLLRVCFRTQGCVRKQHFG